MILVESCSTLVLIVNAPLFLIISQICMGKDLKPKYKDVELTFFNNEEVGIAETCELLWTS